MNAKHSELSRYDEMCNATAAQVIKNYSTSFHAATCLYPSTIRRDIRNLYAVVRIADEIVDGAHSQAFNHKLHDQALQTNKKPATNSADNYGPAEPEYAARRQALDAYEVSVLQAPHHRFHTDPILHAYSSTARRCGFASEHLAAFFNSMRMDISHASFNDAELADYIYGSAEVIGLLCLDIFFADQPQRSCEQRNLLCTGARRLGAGFQKLNFLRDYVDDRSTRQRDYYPSLRGGANTETFRQLLDEVHADLAAGQETIKLLPHNVQPAVRAATFMYADLAKRLAKNPAAALNNGRQHRRISVPNYRKFTLLAQSLATTGVAVTRTKIRRSSPS